MREALKFKNTPVVWALFVMFAMVYGTGFNRMGNIFREPLLVAFCIGVGLTYFNLFSDNLTVTRYRSLWRRIQSGAVMRVWHILPLWVVSVVLTMAVALLMIGLNPTSLVLTLSILCFLFRDSLIIHYFYLNSKGRSPILAITVCFGILYFLLPGLLKLIMGEAFLSFSTVFYPPFAGGRVVQLLPVVVECVLVFFCLSRLFAQANQAMEQPILS